MKGLIAASFLLIGAVCAAQTKSHCSVLVKIDSIMYADTDDEKVDSVTICDDGEATAFHSFTEPALGAAPPQRTKWDYSRQIDRDALSDLQKFIRRKDIADVYERMKIVKTGPVLYVVMHFQIVDQGKERTIAFRAPMLACTDDPPKLPKGLLELMCLFGDLYNEVKTGVSPQNGCGCKSLREMALAPQTGQ